VNVGNGFKAKMSRRIIPLLALLIMGVTGTVDAQEKVTIGLVEDVVLMPWKIRLPARIDTGAAVSSLDARGLKVIDQEVEFVLPSKYGEQKIRLPIAGWHTVRSAEAKERRPIIEIELCRPEVDPGQSQPQRPDPDEMSLPPQAKHSAGNFGGLRPHLLRSSEMSRETANEEARGLAGILPFPFHRRSPCLSDPRSRLSSPSCSSRANLGGFRRPLRRNGRRRG
jgi:hypothetical protein